MLCRFHSRVESHEAKPRSNCRSVDMPNLRNTDASSLDSGTLESRSRRMLSGMKKV